MPNTSEKLLRIGIECESIEEHSWGVGRVVYKLLEQLAARPELGERFRFFLYFKNRIPDYPFLKSPLFVCQVTRPSWCPSSFNLHYHVWMLWHAYRDGVTTLHFPNYMLPLLWFRKSIVMLTDDIWYEMRSPKVPFRYRLAYGIFSRWAAHHATRVMAISRASGTEVARLFGINLSRIAINELAVDPPSPLSTDHSPLSTSSYLLYVGQAFPRRHLRETLLAFADIAPTHPNLQFVFAGIDRYTPLIIASLIADINATLGRQAIIHFERVDDKELTALYSNAQALAYISAREGFGLPPLEALSYGVPAVLADTPLNREIYGEQAFYVTNPESVDDIGSALVSAIDDQSARERIKSAASDIVTRYTWSAHTDRWLNIISTL